MGWIHYALITALALASADFFVKLAAGRLSNSLGLLLYGSCTFLTGGGSGSRGSGLTVYHNMLRHRAFLAALGVGVAFSGVTLGLYTTFGAGVPISVGAPVIRLGGLVLASLAGLILLQEPLTLRYVIGMILVCSGVYLIIAR